MTFKELGLCSFICRSVHSSLRPFLGSQISMKFSSHRRPSLGPSSQHPDLTSLGRPRAGGLRLLFPGGQDAQGESRCRAGGGGVRAGNPVFTALFSFQFLEKENRALGVTLNTSNRLKKNPVVHPRCSHWAAQELRWQGMGWEIEGEESEEVVSRRGAGREQFCERTLFGVPGAGDFSPGEVPGVC